MDTNTEPTMLKGLGHRSFGFRVYDASGSSLMDVRIHWLQNILGHTRPQYGSCFGEILKDFGPAKRPACPWEQEGQNMDIDLLNPHCRDCSGEARNLQCLGNHDAWLPASIRILCCAEELQDCFLAPGLPEQKQVSEASPETLKPRPWLLPPLINSWIVVIM